MDTLEDQKSKLDAFIGKKVAFIISDSISHQFVMEERTLKENIINSHLQMVLSYFSDSESPNFAINGEVLFSIDEGNKRTSIVN